MATTSTMTAAEFLSTLGVNTHTSTGAANYGNIPEVISDLQYLGISNVRDGDNGSLANLITMAQAGIKFDFLMAGGGAITTSHLQQEFTVINQVSQAVPGSVAAVEGANEINNFPITYNGVGGLQGAVNMQEALYSMAHSNSSLPGISVYYFTGYNAGSDGVGPNPAATSGLADYDTQHPYPQNGEPPANWVSPAQALGNESSPYGPAVYTETGYSNSGTFGDNIGLQGQAAYTLDLLMDDAKNGIARTYLYELMEEGDGFGLFTTSNAPTPAATAIHNLTSILADSGTVPSGTTAASFSISNLPSDGNDMALIKSTGATDIIVWAEPQITASSSGPTETVTVALGTTYASVQVYDPTQSSSPIQTLADVSSVQVAITDHPIVIQVNSTTISGGSPPPSPTFITGPTAGSGSHSLVLDLSASEAKETVQVSVNGKTEFKTAQPVTALQSALQEETFTINGTWRTPPSVTVTFANSTGKSVSGASMYIDGATYNGSAVSAATATLTSSSHTHTFTA